MEEILKELGSPGRYHVLLAVMLAVTWWSVALGNVSMTFYGYTPKYYCNIPESDQLERTSLANSTTHNNETRYSPDMLPTKETTEYNISVSKDQCSYDIINNDTVKTYPCTSWNFDREGKELNTIVTEWSLVCQQKYKVSLSSTVFFAGVFCGALFFGFISDHLGRKKTLAICLYSQMPISLAIAFIPDFVSFTVLRFILGVWLQGISTVAFVHCIEFFRQKYRGIVMIGFGMSWAFGQMLTAFMAYILTDWRHMQIFAATVAATTIPYFWWIPESPRWLLVKKRYDEIVDIFICRAAKVNGLDVVPLMSSARQQLDDVVHQQKLTASSNKTESFSHIIRTPLLLKRLIFMCYTWCSSSLAYYIFLLNIRDLAGDRYLNFTIGACLEVLMNFIIIYIMLKFGRKRPLITFCFIVAILCLICGTLPSKVGNKDIRLAVTFLALLGKMAMSAVMCLIFVYAAELFPTFARGSCMALCGCSLRIGGTLAPQILYLRSLTFEAFPYIFISAAIVLPAIFTIFLPETFGKKLPNTIGEAVKLQPEQGPCTEQELMKVDDTSNDSNSTDSDYLTSQQHC